MPSVKIIEATCELLASNLKNVALFTVISNPERFAPIVDNSYIIGLAFINYYIVYIYIPGICLVFLFENLLVFKVIYSI